MTGSKLLRTAERRDGNRPCRKLSEKGKTVCNSHLSVLSYSFAQAFVWEGLLSLVLQHRFELQEMQISIDSCFSDQIVFH